jgi:hypothetical protein
VFLTWQVIVDEAHHSVAATYTSILEGLGFIEEMSAGKGMETAEEQLSMQHSSASTADSGGSSSTYGSSSGSAELGSLYSQAKEILRRLDEAGEAADAGVLRSTGSNTGSNSSVDKEDEPKVVMRAKPNPNQLMLGFTATPYRMKKAESSELYSIFPTTYVRTIPEMIRAGHLSEVRGCCCRSQAAACVFVC